MIIRRIATVLAFVFSASAAEPVDLPGPFLPWPEPGFMKADTNPVTSTITAVESGLPGAAAGLKVGDVLVRWGGLPMSTSDDWAITRWSNATRDSWAAEIIRGGERRTVMLVGCQLNGLRMGITFSDPPGVELAAPAADALMERSLPWRARSAAGRWATAHPGDQAWWVALQADLRAALASQAPPPEVAQPTPFLSDLDHLYRRAAAAHATGHAVPATSVADEAWMAAAFYPFPTTEGDSKVGTITAGGAVVAEHLTRFAASGESDPDEASRLVMQGGSELDTYRNQVLAAILDEGNHGGWPFRSVLIYTPEARRGIVEGLRQAAGKPGSDPQVDALARIGPAVIDRDWPALRQALDDLHQGSPWLAHQGWQIARHAARMWQQTDALLAQAAKKQFPGMVKLSPIAEEILRRSGTDAQDMPEPDDLGAWLNNHPATALTAFWSPAAGWWGMVWEGHTELAKSLNRVAWDIATDPAQLDPAGAGELARQITMASADQLPVYVADTVAACWARHGEPGIAAVWQDQVMRRSNDADQDGYRARAQAFHAGHAWQEEFPAGTAQSIVVGDRTWSGVVRGGGQWGVWTATTADKKVREQIGYSNGSLHGRWLVWDATGALESAGVLNHGTRIGWWRERTAAGGMAEGWYFRQREGWWRIRDAAGEIISEGLCRAGAPVDGTWTRSGPEGVRLPLPIAEVQLPVERPLPATGTVGVPPPEPGTQPDNPVNF